MSVQEDLDLLRSIRGRIATHQQWCKDYLGTYTRDTGRVCLLGAAMWSVGQPSEFGQVEDQIFQRLTLRLKVLLRLEEDTSVTDFNDNTTHRLVLQRVDDAIARLEEQIAGEPLGRVATAEPEKDPLPV